MKRGVLLLAHGARDADWVLPFERVAAQLRSMRPGVEVRLAFLEFMAPDLHTAGGALASLGCVRIDVVPLFLGAGGHVRKDVPDLMQQMVERHPGVSWQLRPAIGERAEVITAMARAAAHHLAEDEDR